MDKFPGDGSYSHEQALRSRQLGRTEGEARLPLVLQADLDDVSRVCDCYADGTGQHRCKDLLVQQWFRDVIAADRISDGVVERNADSSEDERAMKAGGESLVED